MVAHQLAMLKAGVRFPLGALMSRTQKVLGSLIVFTFMTMVGFHFFVPRHASSSKEVGSYTLDVPFDRVRKILIKTDSLEEIVRYQHGQVLHQEWEDLNVSTDRIIGGNGWDIVGHGSFVVRAEDPDAGELILHFNQYVEIKKNSMVSRSWLSQPVGNLKEYETKMVMVGEGEQTKVSNEVYLKYERRLPQTHIDYMDGRVRESAKKAIAKSREGMTNFIEKYRDKKFIIPIRR